MRYSIPLFDSVVTTNPDVGVDAYNAFKTPFDYGKPTGVRDIDSCTPTIHGDDPSWTLKLPSQYKLEHIYLLSRRDSDWDKAVGIDVKVGVEGGELKTCGTTKIEQKLGWHRVTCEDGEVGDTVVLSKSGKIQDLRFCGFMMEGQNVE